MGGVEKQEILLESGTNEMEIIEFYVGTQPLGINVQKLKEIISLDESALTVVPETPPAMLGVLMMRGSTIPLIDLKGHLKQRNREQSADAASPVVLVCEFNHRINGFKVDGVNQIHRVSWSDLQPLAPFIDQYRPRFTGSINIDGREILILDLEYIVGEFDPDSVLKAPEEEKVGRVCQDLAARRAEKKVLMAEDSSVIRSGMANVLKDAGFAGLEVFVDGQDAYTRILDLKAKAGEAGEDLRQSFHLLISDIEMPRMDGLTLCRKVKEGLGYADIPVLLFSSLINPPMEVKCDSVGADGYAAKPEIAKLISMMDHFLGVAVAVEVEE